MGYGLPDNTVEYGGNGASGTPPLRPDGTVGNVGVGLPDDPQNIDRDCRGLIFPPRNGIFLCNGGTGDPSPTDFIARDTIVIERNHGFFAK